MAKEEPLQLLKQGVDAWNKWRNDNLEIKPDISAANLQEINLSYANFQGVDFSDSDLSDAKFRFADFTDANLNRAKLNRTNLHGADLKKSDLRRTNFHEANLSFSKLDNANLSHSNLNEANLYNASLIETDLSWAVLYSAMLERAILIRSNLTNANLNQVNLRFADLTRAMLNSANLIRADLSDANLYNVSLADATLLHTNLSRTNLNDTEFRNAAIGAAIFGNVDLSRAKGLDSIRPLEPSTIGIDTIYKSSGEISEIFLRGCGVPEVFATYIPSLITAEHPIELSYYSCFISYNRHDEEFSKLLYLRLMSENIRTWFAPADMKGGRKIYEQIDNAIKIHDKLLVVISEHSMKSEWVISEIRKARKLELKEGYRKLFPIRLVDFDKIKEWECFDSDIGKDLAIEIREYFISDFSNWREHDSFTAAFEKLLGDLQSEDKIK